MEMSREEKEEALKCRGCWGNSMDGVTPERGIWWHENANYDGKPPVRIWPKDG